MPEDDLPDDPVGPIKESAISTYEVFIAYLQAGFNEFQALELTKTLLLAGVIRGVQGSG